MQKIMPCIGIRFDVVQKDARRALQLGQGGGGHQRLDPTIPLHPRLSNERTGHLTVLLSEALHP